MKPVRVAFFPMHPPDDRATGTFCELPAARLGERGVSGTVFAPSSTRLRDAFYRGKSPGWRLRAAVYWYGIVLPRRLAQIWRARRCDAIFVQRSMFRWSSPPVLEWLAARLTGLPIAYHLDDGVWLAARRRWTEARCRLAAEVVTGNERIAEFAEAAGARVTRIEYAVDVGAYPVREHRDGAATIGYTGIAPEEHLAPVAGALREVCEETGARLRVVGGPRRPRLPGLEPHLEWRPWDPADEHSWAGEMDIGIMPLTDSEIHRTKEPLKVKEYMAAGLPVVLSPVGHNLELVTEGREGLFASGEEQWRERLGRLARDPALRAELGAGGRALVARRYDLPRMLEDLAALFRRLAGRRGGEPDGPAADAPPKAAPPDAGAADPSRPLAGSFAATASIQLVQAAIAIILARLLGPDGRGELAAVILWPTVIMTLGNLGLAQAITYHAARAPRPGALLGSALALVAAESLALVGIGLAVLPLALSNHEPEVVRTAQLFLLAFLPFSLLSLAMMSLLNGLHRFRWFNGLRLGQFVAILGGIGGLALAGSLSLGSAAAAYAGAHLLTALVATGAVLGVVGERPRASRETLRSLLSFGARSQLSTTMWALNERVDQLAISVFLSAASLGLYVVAVTLTSLTTLVGFSFALVALPVLARMGSGEEWRQTASAIAGATVALGALVSVPLLIAAPQLVELLFGAEFQGSVDVARVLLLAAMVFALNRVLEAFLQAAGRPLDSSLGEGIGLAVTAAGLAVLLPALGILGAGVTSLLAYSTSALFLVRRAARALEVPAARLLVPERRSLARLLRMATAGRGGGPPRR